MIKSYGDAVIGFDVNDGVVAAADCMTSPWPMRYPFIRGSSAWDAAMNGRFLRTNQSLWDEMAAVVVVRSS